MKELAGFEPLVLAVEATHRLRATAVAQRALASSVSDGLVLQFPLGRLNGWAAFRSL